MSTKAAVSSLYETRFMPSLIAAAALAAAAGALALGVSVPGSGGGTHPTDGLVHPGKVSVLGRAKVRTWSAQTFSLQIPLKWREVLENPSTHVYGWAQTAPGVELSSETLVRQAAGDWARAKQLVRTRITVAISSSSAGRDAKPSALAFSRSDVRYTDAFLDLGPVHFGPMAWRFDVAVAGTIESHYFFSTCAGGRRRESWHITVNRSQLHGVSASQQSQAINAIFTSLKTVYPFGRGADGADCGAA
jgi:hypothetical protein